MEAVSLNINRELVLNLHHLVRIKKAFQIPEIAREVGYSRTAISRYIDGLYESEKLETLLESWYEKHVSNVVELEVAASRKALVKPAFFESRDAKNVLGVCQSSQEYGGLGIVVGRSGYGKTHTLRQYAKLGRVAYIECDDTMAGRDLVEAIERALGLPSGYGTIWRRVNSIRDFFNANSGYLLVIDEADKLISKYTQKKMEILRAIFDQSSVGLVIAGEPRLEAQIKTYLDRMANRVDFHAELHGLTASEVESYLGGCSMTPEALNVLKARACNSRNGCFRLLDRTLANVRRIIEDRGEDVITDKTIEQASGMMML